MNWGTIITGVLSDPTVQALTSELQHELVVWIMAQLGATGADPAKASAMKAAFLARKGS